MRALLPWQFVRVDGHSMTPTLRPGDRLLARHGAPVRPGVIVLASFRSRPGLTVVKRAVRPDSDGWWLASDNARAGTDSLELGPADVQAVCGWLWRTPTSGRFRTLRGMVPHRPAAAPPDGL